MFQRIFIAFALVAFACVPAAHAQFRQGDWELTLQGSGSSDNTFDGGAFQINGSVGYFTSDQLEVFLRQGIGYTDLTNEWSGATRVGANYHFDYDRWQPYVGANIGYVYGGEFRDTWAAGPEAGVKYFVRDGTFVYGSLGYDFFFRNASNLDDDFENGQFVYGVGIGFTW